jgi:hypothetical protein
MKDNLIVRSPDVRGELVPRDSELFEVVIRWSPYDVIEIFGDLGIAKTLAEAEEWLRDIAHGFQGFKDKATEAGYALLRERAEESI